MAAVTGGAGFIGEALCRRLVESKEYDCVVALARKMPTEPLPGVDYVLGDVTDFNSVRLLTRQARAVFHLASIIKYSKKDRAEMDAVNVKGTENVARACIENQVSVMVLVSSMAAIGANDSESDPPLEEDSRFTLSHLNLGYFETKRAAEQVLFQLCEEFTSNLSTRFVIVNPTNVYGAGDALKDSRSTQLKTAQGRFPFYSSGGVNIVHIGDVVDGIILAEKKGKHLQRYILGGDNIKIKDLLAIVAREGGSSPPWIWLPTIFMMALGWFGVLPYEKVRVASMYFWYSSAKAKRDLGYEPKPAEFALKESVAWMKKHFPANSFKRTDASRRLLIKISAVLTVIIASVSFAVMKRH